MGSCSQGKLARTQSVTSRRDETFDETFALGRPRALGWALEPLRRSYLTVILVLVAVSGAEVRRFDGHD